MNYTIREVTMEDVKALIEHKEIVTKENPDTLATEVDDKKATNEEQEARIQSLSTHDLGLVALDGEKIIGILNLRQLKRKKFSHVAQLSISIQNEYTGSGLGSKMIEQALDFVKQDEVLNKVMLTVFENNIGAIKLYERMGFVEEARLKDQVFVLGEYKDLIYMANFLK